jgi:hypothetical protein
MPNPCLSLWPLPHCAYFIIRLIVFLTHLCETRSLMPHALAHTYTYMYTHTRRCRIARRGRDRHLSAAVLRADQQGAGCQNDADLQVRGGHVGNRVRVSGSVLRKYFLAFNLSFLKNGGLTKFHKDVCAFAIAFVFVVYLHFVVVMPASF